MLRLRCALANRIRSPAQRRAFVTPSYSLKDEGLPQNSTRGHAYERGSNRDLPNPSLINWGFVLPFGAAVGGAWFYFLLFATNDERWSASIVKQVYSNIRESEDVTSLLGDVHPQSAWWLVGNKPWVSGKIQMAKGIVDVSFPVEGSKGSGTVYFTSLRTKKGGDFQNIRYKVVAADGTEIDLLGSLG